uniref:DUF7668 domain-containing protein n=1 Tax=Altererythrobacter segetis TaxID=1104773 RepID=UPI001409E766|nr:hypothetical protein [Altererythrobacter segetis]
MIKMPKDEAEHPIPQEWRSTFRQIASAFAEGDFQLSRHSIDGVAPVPDAVAESIADNVRDYGGYLAPLSEITWERSVCRWMDGYWQVLVDLTTDGELVSDLTLHAKINEHDGARWEIESVHVP